MIQRDLIQKQIEQLGQVMGKALTTMLDFDGPGNVIDHIQTSRDLLVNELNMDPESILDFDPDQLEDFLESHAFNAAVAEQFATYFFEWGKLILEKEPKKATSIFQKSLFFLELAGTQSGIFSISRQMRIDEVKQFIDK